MMRAAEPGFTSMLLSSTHNSWCTASETEERTWKKRVWNLVKATPTLRSSSCRASTDRASFLLGYPSLFCILTQVTDGKSNALI